MTEPGGDRVLTIRCDRQTDVTDLMPAARGVAQECRRLYFAGYDLRSFEITAHVVRDDRPIEIGRENSQGNR